MTAIHATEVLAYYDGVEVFQGADEAGNCYVGQYLDYTGAVDRYLVVQADAGQLNDLKQGLINLRTLLLQAADHGWYLTHVDGDSDEFTLLPQTGDLAATDFLPNPGFFMDLT